MANNKKKVMSTVMAITTAMGTLMEGTMAITAVNVDKNQLWSQAYTYTMKAKKSGLQEDINVARKAINALSEGLSSDKKLREQLTGTLSAMLDPVQQSLFVKLYEVIYEQDMVTKKKILPQEKINEARKLIKGFASCKENQDYIPSWSVVIDEFQQGIINAVIENIKNVKEKYELEDIDKTTECINELLKVTDNDLIKLKAQELNIEFLSTLVKGGKIIDFRKSYSNILLKKDKDLSTNDKKTVEAAIEYIDILPEDIKAILKDEVTKLKEQKKLIDNMASETLPYYPPVIDNISDVDRFKKDYAEIFSMDLDESIIRNKTYIDEALHKFNSLSKSDKAALKKEEEKLNSLVNFINQFIEKSVFTFKTSHRELLNKTVDTVNISDKKEIADALKEFEGFHGDMKAKLIKEAEILTKLNAKLNGDLLCELNVSVKGKFVTISGIATEYDDNGMILIVKDTQGNICYFDQISMNSQGKFSVSFDFTNNMFGVKNITGSYRVCMKIQGSDLTSKELNFSIENIIKLEVEEFQTRNKDVVIDMNDKNVKIGDDVRIKEVIDEINTLSPEAQLALKEKKVELEKLLVIIAGKNVEKEVADFKAAHNAQLILTESVVSVSNREAVQKAVDDYELLSKEAKALLVEEKANLDKLMKKINDLRIDVDAADFAKSYKDILQKTIDTVQSGDKEITLAAIAKYDDLQQGSKDIVDSNAELTTHGHIKEHLQKLMDKVSALIFKANHVDILGVSVSGVTLEHEAAIKSAEDEYATLNEVSKSYLADEAKALEVLRAEIERLKSFDKLTKTITSAKGIKKVEEPDSNIVEGSKIVGSWAIFQECIASAEKVQASDTIENINKAISALETAKKSYEDSNVKLIDAVGVVDGRVNSKIGETLEVKIPLQNGESLVSINDVVWDLNNGKWVKVANKKTTTDSLLVECILKTADKANINVSIKNSEGNVIKIVKVYLTITEKTADDKVNEFKNAHKAAFELTSENVSINDEAIIKTAISEYDKLTDDSLKSAIRTDVEKLIALLSVISDKKVEKFRSDFSSVLGLTVDNVILENRTDIISALSAYAELDESAKNKLVEEKGKLEALKVATDGAAVKKDADDFKTKYDSVLKLTVDTVKLQDKTSIENALRDFNALQDGAKKLFENDMVAMLQGLLDKIASLGQEETEFDIAKQELKTLVEQCRKLHDEAEEGDYAELHLKGSKTIFDNAIKEANIIFSDPNSKIANMKKAIDDLQIAKSKFEGSTVKSVTLCTGNKITIISSQVGKDVEINILEGAILEGESIYNTYPIYEDRGDYVQIGKVCVENGKIIVSLTEKTTTEMGGYVDIPIYNAEGISVKSATIVVVVID
ncbi:hypothetical protein SAMN02745248_02136 [Hathewaya proteolytica DSM 3090]|uniref:Uncharacterized protein n=1 Tax=Hathewaya proteolytica DSM 3090 TaxID=1121331 RepID=A0A1M6QWN7_9CLOT|nr:hypothetical protein [Hathewaya proteolytica]SHK24596.1 hypothetical protein SAMN02745248_02136 [Hathewaya proteolytica DSM 3090]